jgi:hypothetical protein
VGDKKVSAPHRNPGQHKKEDTHFEAYNNVEYCQGSSHHFYREEGPAERDRLAKKLSRRDALGFCLQLAYFFRDVAVVDILAINFGKFLQRRFYIARFFVSHT